MSQAVRITTTDESRHEEVVPYAGMAVAAGGLNHDHLVVSWGAGASARTLYLKDPALIVAFRRYAPSDLTDHLERTARQVRRSRRRHSTIWAVAIGFLVGLGLFFWFGSDLLVRWAVQRIPVEWEEKLGAAAYREALSGKVVVKEGPAVDALQEMTRRLTSTIVDSPYKFEMSLVAHDVVNAFALPGGRMVVFTGLLTKAESGEEVAGVLSHEISHVLERHGVERIVKQLGLVAVASILFGDQQGLVGLAQQLGMDLLTLRFNREQETEADLVGLHLLSDARIARDGMIRFFERLSEQDKDHVELFSTHPMSAVRAARLKAEIALIPKRASEPFGFDWSKVQASVDHRRSQSSR
jgi:Zn-dependent protease with chaperone function